MAPELNRDNYSSELSTQPTAWLKIVAVRSALRALPKLAASTNEWLRLNALNAFRASVISWAVHAYATPDIVAGAASAGASRVQGDGPLSQAARPARAAMGAILSAAKASGGSRGSGDAAYTIGSAALALDEDSGGHDIWQAAQDDFEWLADNNARPNVVRELSRRPLWADESPDWFDVERLLLMLKMDKERSSFIVWINIIFEIINGTENEFKLVKDFNNSLSLEIFNRLGRASNAEFWEKGPKYVNNTLIKWIEEANARVAPEPDEQLPEAPAQDQSAVAYGVNQEGKVDRLPTSNQQHLRDQPDQRQIYADVREAFDELRAEGQRLGETLASALDRIMRSMPEAFEDAQAYLVWRDGNRLRRILLAHQAVALHTGPDPAKLDLAVAAQLDETLKLYNLFAFGDEGLRAKDENAIPPQERISGAREAELAKPVVTAILASPDIASQDVRDDVRASLDDSDVPPDNPYAPHTIDQNIRTWRNLIAAVVAYGRANPVVALVGGGLATGIATAAGEAIFTDVMGTTQVYAPLINFIVVNAPAIKAYALTAYSNGSVGIIIDAIVRQVRGVE